MIAANALPKEEYPEFDEETGILPKVDDDEGKTSFFLIFFYLMRVALNDNFSSVTFPSSDEDLEIDLVEEEPPFLRGQTKWSMNLSPVKIVKVNIQTEASRLAGCEQKLLMHFNIIFYLFCVILFIRIQMAPSLRRP